MLISTNSLIGVFFYYFSKYRGAHCKYLHNLGLIFAFNLEIKFIIAFNGDIKESKKQRRKNRLRRSKQNFVRLKLLSPTKIVETIEVADTGRNNLIF